jgi:hypothetical protein
VSLEETSRLFTEGFNQFVRLGWDAKVGNATKLHYLAYYPVRERLPTLNSNLINTARAKASEALRSAFALQEQERKVSMPMSGACSPRYNVHTYRVDWESQTVRMWRNHCAGEPDQHSEAVEDPQADQDQPPGA